MLMIFWKRFAWSLLVVLGLQFFISLLFRTPVNVFVTMGVCIGGAVIDILLRRRSHD